MYIAIIILGISILGLVGLIGFKAAEDRFGRFFFSGMRQRAGEALDKRFENIKKTMPHATARAARLTTRIVRAYASFGIAKALMGLENMLEGGLKHLRRAPRKLEQSGQASHFLREVAAYKRLLSKEEKKGEGEAVEQQEG